MTVIAKESLFSAVTEMHHYLETRVCTGKTMETGSVSVYARIHGSVSATILFMVEFILFHFAADDNTSR